MSPNELKSLIDSRIADFHSSCLNHTDDLSCPVTYEDFDNAVSKLTKTLNECFSFIIDSLNK